MKKFTLVKLMLGIVLIFSSSTYVYTASENEKPQEEKHSSSIDAEEETGEKQKTEVPSKRIRSGFGYEKLPEGAEQPWKLIRGLQLLQDDIVQGEVRAQDAYKLLLLHLPKVMSSLDNSVWDHERNLDAMAVYMLLGGKTELGYKALQKTNLNNLQKQPLEAAIAYAERDLGKAYELMLELDHLALPPSMSAQFALAKSMIVSSTNLDLALIYLREARRLAPGTLIEEGAIRRSIRIAGETKAIEDFYQLSRTYLRRFRSSHYFNDFLRNFGFALVRMPRNKEAELLDFLKEILSHVDDAQQVTVAAYIARHTIISGRRKISLWASNMALERLAEGSVLYKRMQLYSASVKIVNQENSQAAMTILETIIADKLDHTDQKILSTAKMLGKQILQNSAQVKVVEQDENTDILNNQFVQRANKLLASSQSALKEVTQ